MEKNDVKSSNPNSSVRLNRVFVQLGKRNYEPSIKIQMQFSKTSCEIDYIYFIFNLLLRDQTSKNTL